MLDDVGSGKDEQTSLKSYENCTNSHSKQGQYSYSILTPFIQFNIAYLKKYSFQQ